MSKREVPIEIFDKPRKLKFRFQDIEELCRRLNVEGIVDLVAKAQSGSPDFITYGLLAGLRHEDGKLSVSKIWDMVDRYLEKDDSGGLPAIISILDDALTASGIFKQREENAESNGAGEGQPDPPAPSVEGSA